ncbi:MAG: cupin domain-containing protein [Anaerolineales bacterium]|nr:cupin domain-containing protein [Anaerolineales bacterium]
MNDGSVTKKLQDQEGGRKLRRRRMERGRRFVGGNASALDVNVGQRLRQLRSEHELSLSALADISGLNINTLSLIENDKISPSVSTLQKLALALDVPVGAFFEVGVERRNIIFQKAGQRPRATFAHGMLEDLGTELASRWAEPFVVTLEAGADSGETPILHTGLEFVYCLEGRIAYTIESQQYMLEPGDSLLFEARLPHRWQNTGVVPARSLLVLCPADERDRPTSLHFVSD